eukprot:856465-Pyramimonas_sp.AAC.1
MGALMRGVAKGLVSEEALGDVKGIIIDSAPGVINAGTHKPLLRSRFVAEEFTSSPFSFRGRSRP